jgi:hypothetical protein
MTNPQYKIFLEVISIKKPQFRINNSDLRKIDIEILPLFMDYLTGKSFNATFTVKESEYKKSINRITLSDNLWYKHNGNWLSRAESFTLNCVMKSFCEYNSIEWDNCYSSDNIMIYLENIKYDKEVQKQFMLDLTIHTQDFITYIKRNHND